MWWEQGKKRWDSASSEVGKHPIKICSEVSENKAWGLGGLEKSLHVFQVDQDWGTMSLHEWTCNKSVWNSLFLPIWKTILSVLVQLEEWMHFYWVLWVAKRRRENMGEMWSVWLIADKSHPRTISSHPSQRWKIDGLVIWHISWVECSGFWHCYANENQWSPSPLSTLIGRTETASGEMSSLPFWSCGRVNVWKGSRDSETIRDGTHRNLHIL